MNSCTVEYLKFNERSAAEQNCFLWLYLLYLHNENTLQHRNLLSKTQIDYLTRLGNREFFESTVRKYLFERSSEAACALFIIDVDDFKKVNDTYGHLTGDKVLINIAKILKNSFVKGDAVSRIGGDEFVAFMKNVDSKEALLEKTQLICDLVNKCSDFPVSVSIGIHLLQDKQMNFEELFKKADIALYQAKLNGKNSFHLYRETDNPEKGKMCYCLEKPPLLTVLHEEIILRMSKDKLESGFMLFIAAVIFSFIVFLGVRMIGYGN